jgi:hypothetical protein
MFEFIVKITLNSQGNDTSTTNVRAGQSVLIKKGTRFKPTFPVDSEYSNTYSNELEATSFKMGDQYMSASLPLISVGRPRCDVL